MHSVLISYQDCLQVEDENITPTKHGVVINIALFLFYQPY